MTYVPYTINNPSTQKRVSHNYRQMFYHNRAVEKHYIARSVYFILKTRTGMEYFNEYIRSKYLL